MTVAPGTRLGPYEIVSPLGAGGMGEVYRARDTKLGRDVAVKVLPADLANDPEALSRLEREARAVAQLSHPNILAIYDFGRQGETAYAVTELLEGETLRARLEHGALPARKAVDLAVQMAEGLAAAHEKGNVHRDLKPENVFVTAEGRVKLLDFGLAKRTVPATGPISGLLTADKYTEPGTVLGTVRYMSPEQVRGEAVDHRSDIFSFGAVLYEMLAGRQAFGRETATESMTAILKEDPAEFAASGSGPPPALQRIVQHCLEKKPGERFQSARDIAFDLRALSGWVVASGPTRAATRRGWRQWLTAIAVAAVMGVAGLALYRRGEKAGLRSAAEVSFRKMSYRPQAVFQAAFAPDGETIVYSAALEGNVPELFAIRPEYPEPRPLGLPRTHLLSISSKGELAVLTNARFVAQRLFVGTLARVSLGGTAPREILEEVRQADWSPDGSELAIIRMSEGKDRLEFPIGKVLYETAGYLSDLRVSPRGDRIALFEHPAHWDDRGSVIVADRAGKRTFLSGGYWAEEGLSWSREGDEILLAVIFTPPQLVIYPTGPGEVRRLPRGDLETYHSAGWFPDGKSVLAVGNEAGKASRCYAQDVSGGLPRPVTPEATTNCLVSPDGLQMLYSRPDETWLIQRAGSATAQPVPGLHSDDHVVRWSADGRSFFVFRPANVPFRFERVNLVSGRRELVREVAPADWIGVLHGVGAALTDDTKSYAYDYFRMTSQLFVVEGVR